MLSQSVTQLLIDNHDVMHHSSFTAEHVCVSVLCYIEQYVSEMTYFVLSGT